jgi:hypothetical protein
VKNENWRFSEEFKHQCGVRHILKARQEQGLRNFREWVVKTGLYKRWHLYEKDFNAQWRKGNRGKTGDWRE